MKMKLLIGALVSALVVCACDAPTSVKKPDSKVPDKGAVYPKIVSVSAEDVVFFYNSQILLDNFSVYYLEEEGGDEKVASPSTGEGEGFLINGKHDYVFAGIIKEGEEGRYGWQDITFSLAESPQTTYTFKVFVVAETVDYPKADKFDKLEVVREPIQTSYDRGEPFNAQGMVVIAWYDGTEAGARKSVGGTPLHASLLEIDDSQLLAATTPGSNVPINISYTDDRSQTKSTSYTVTMQLKFHEVQLVNVAGIINFVIGSSSSSSTTAATGAYVTVGINLDDDYVLEADGLNIEIINKEGDVIGRYEGVLSELAPESFTRKIAFAMPRNKVRISGKVVQLKSGLGALEYKVGSGTYRSVPGFNKDNHHLSQQLVIKPNVADGTEPNKLYIKASPRDDMPENSMVTIQVRQGAANFGPGATTESTHNVLNPAEAAVTTLAAGQNHLFQVDVAYQAPGASAATVRTYELLIMKSEGGAAGDGVGGSITYDYTGGYQIYTPQEAGWYKFEAWGANGGSAFEKTGGKGGYASGMIYLDPDGGIGERMPLYIYVGGKGGSKPFEGDYTPGPGGWNGGGRGGESSSRGGAGGGGATSVSTVAGVWNSIPVLANRILVAGGGGGASANSGTHLYTTDQAPGVIGSPGGGISGSSARTVLGIKYGAYTALTATGAEWLFPSDDSFAPAQKPPAASDPTAGVNGQGFGVGGYGREGDAPDYTRGDGYNGKGGGGGGWWGGRISLYRGSDEKARNAGAGGGGGSNYISGYSGCYAVEAVYMEDEKLVVESKSNSGYAGRGSSGPSPVVNGVDTSPVTGTVLFYNGHMNAHYEVGDDIYEPKSEDDGGIFNPNADGNGRLKITFLGAGNSSTPPSAE